MPGKAIMHPMKRAPAHRRRRVKAYSYSRIAGNYIRPFSLPGKIILFLIIIVLILIFSVIFIGAVL